MRRSAENVPGPRRRFCRDAAAALGTRKASPVEIATPGWNVFAMEYEAVSTSTGGRRRGAHAAKKQSTRWGFRPGAAHHVNVFFSWFRPAVKCENAFLQFAAIQRSRLNTDQCGEAPAFSGEHRCRWDDLTWDDLTRTIDLSYDTMSCDTMFFCARVARAP
jgi:hypothetical protein